MDISRGLCYNQRRKPTEFTKGIPHMNENKATEIRPSDLWTVLKRCWIAMLALALVAGGAFFAYAKLTHEPQYTSTATLYVSRETGNTVTATDISIATTLIKDFVELNINDSIVEQAKQNAQSPLSVFELARMATLTYTEGTRVMYVTVTADDPQTAQVLANAFADAVCEEFNSLFDVVKEDGTVLTQRMLGVHSYGTGAYESNPVSFKSVWISALVSPLAVYLVALAVYLIRREKRNLPTDERI